MVQFKFKSRKFKEINFFKILLALVIAFEQTINEVNVTSNPATDSTSLWLYLVRIGRSLCHCKRSISIDEIGFNLIWLPYC